MAEKQMAEKSEHRKELEARAAELGLSYPANLGDTKLAERISEAGNGGDPVSALRVTGPKKGFWRAGRKFGPAAIDVPIADLSDDQVIALKNEPRLVVAEVEIDGQPE